MTQNLTVVKTEENLKYAEALAAENITVVPIKRLPTDSPYINRLDFPRRILFEMTSRCNYLCRMCPQQNLKRPRMDMDGAEYRRVIDEIDEYGIEGLWLYHLGESLLHPEFHENVKFIKTKNNLGDIWMSTNGVYFDEKNIGIVLDSNIKWVNFSAHAVTKETYDLVIPEGDFEKVNANLEKFYVLKGSENLPRTPFLHCQMIEQSVTKHEVDLFINKHYKRADVISINMLEYVNLPNNSFGIEQRKRNPLTSCTRISRNDCFICSNGDVTLCDAAYNGEIYLGNIHEQSLYKIWNGERRKKILALNASGRMNEIEFCCNCTDYDI